MARARLAAFPALLDKIRNQRPLLLVWIGTGMVALLLKALFDHPEDWVTYKGNLLSSTDPFKLRIRHCKREGESEARYTYLWVVSCFAAVGSRQVDDSSRSMAFSRLTLMWVSFSFCSTWSLTILRQDDERREQWSAVKRFVDIAAGRPPQGGSGPSTLSAYADQIGGFKELSCDELEALV